LATFGYDLIMMEFPPRIAALRQTLLSRIPCTPEARGELGAEDLRGLIVHYLNYASRFVPPRPRQVIYADGFWTSQAQKLIVEVLAIEREIEAGVEITARLSNDLKGDGYIARKTAPVARPSKWSGKDFALNAFGIHHLHIGARNEKGEVQHADPLLYVRFFRDCAVFLMVGHHKSFDDGSLAETFGRWQAQSGYEVKGIVIPEDQGSDFKEQSQIARRGLSTFAQVNGKLVLGANLSSSGHSAEVSILSGRMVRELKRIEPLLDDRSYLEKVFYRIADRLPEKLDLIWTFDVCDLMLLAPQADASWRVLEMGC
jgi:hypothetical protein